MKKSPFLLLVLLVLPVFAHAQSLQSFLGNIIPVINTTIIPFLLGIAFLIFVINVVRYFVIGGSSEDAQEKARATAMYGVLAFVLIIVFWGVVNLLASSLGLEGERAATPDYFNYSGTQNNPGNNRSPSSPNAANPSNQPPSNGPAFPPPIDPELEGMPCNNPFGVGC